MIKLDFNYVYMSADFVYSQVFHQNDFFSEIFAIAVRQETRYNNKKIYKSIISIFDFLGGIHSGII